MALSLDTTYMRLSTCMALFQRWSEMTPTPPKAGEPDAYADMTIDEIKRSVIRRRLVGLTGLDRSFINQAIKRWHEKQQTKSTTLGCNTS